MKRLFDIVVSASLLVLLLPVLALLVLAVRIMLGSPVLFRQIRPGKDAKPFGMLKFRTMTNACGPDGALLSSHERLVPFGRLLRATSLDELPELWNVLKGDMSLVGPRPLLMEYLPLYSADQARRHDVRPGLTGWAQVNGRNALSWEDKFRLDVEYVDNRNFRLDLLILLKTVGVAFKRSGINAGDGKIMERFKGSHAE